MQPLAILFGAAFTAAVAFSLGAVLLRNSCSDPAVRFVSGAALLSLIVFAACALRIVYPAVFLGLGAASIVAARSEWRDFRRPRLTRWSLLFVPYAVLCFFNAMAPEISYDGSRYHLALAGRYFREHGFQPFTDTMFAAFPQGVEMLYLFAYSFGRHSAAAMVHFLFLIALAWQLYDWGRRRGWTIAGLCAAILVFASPIVGMDAGSAYVDVAVASIAFTLFNVVDLWAETQVLRLLPIIGLLAGFAFAAKYPAALAIPYALVCVFWRNRSLRSVALVGCCAAAVFVPWLVKNWLWFRNPFAPFLNEWFHNPFVTISFEREYIASLASFGPFHGAQIPWQITGGGALSGLFGPVFLLAPIAVLALRWPAGRRLLAAAAVFGVPYFSNVTTRFLIPAFPFVALAMCLVLMRAPKLAIALAVVHAVISWPDVVKSYCSPVAWRLVKVPYREALRIKPEDGFLESNLPYYGITRRIDELTPEGSTVFTETPIPDAYTSRTILVGYQSARNIQTRRIWFSGFVPEHVPVLRTRLPFDPRLIRAFRVIQEGAGQATWSVHEVRAFDAERELSRTGWRATASPFPWGVESVLDGSLTSLWMCGESLRPGQYLQFDFPSPQRVDAVQLDGAPDQYDARFSLEVAGPDGRWEAVRTEVRLDEAPAPPDRRRQVARELKRRGVDYLLAFDGQFGADDLNARQSEWGIQQITEHKGARLYRLP